MNCCGNKRKEWMDQVNSPIPHGMVEQEQDLIMADNPDPVFEYTGNYSMTINGAVSGKSYHFRFTGEKLKVDHSDSFALMAERDLKIATARISASKL